MKDASTILKQIGLFSDASNPIGGLLDIVKPMRVELVSDSGVAVVLRGEPAPVEIVESVSNVVALSALAPSPTLQPEALPVKRGRGRPAGSKNKPKLNADNEPIKPAKSSKKAKTEAKDSVVYEHVPTAAESAIETHPVECMDELDAALADPDFERYYVIGAKSLKHAKIFPPPKALGLDKPRTVILEKASATNRIERKLVLLGNSVTQCYTTETLGVIAVINEMWQEQGSKPDGEVLSTYAEVARRMHWADTGNESRARARVKKEIDRLRRLHLVFTDTTLNAEGERVMDESFDITYFSDYQYNQFRKNPSLNHFRINIHKHIVQKIAMGKIASLPIKSLLELKVNESKPLLLRVDSLMAYKSSMSVYFDDFVDLVSLDPESYIAKKRVHAMKLLANVAKDLDGRILTSGHELRVWVVENIKLSRLSLSFERGELLMTAGGSKNNFVGHSNTDPDEIEYLKRRMLVAVGDNSERVDGLFEVYARAFPRELIERAVSVFNADKPSNVQSAGAYFSSILMRIIGEHGMRWIK